MQFLCEESRSCKVIIIIDCNSLEEERLRSTSKSHTDYQTRMFQLQFSSIYSPLRSAPIHNQRNSSYRFQVAPSPSCSLTRRTTLVYPSITIIGSFKFLGLSLCYQFSRGNFSLFISKQTRIASGAWVLHRKLCLINFKLFSSGSNSRLKLKHHENFVDRLNWVSNVERALDTLTLSNSF